MTPSSQIEREIAVADLLITKGIFMLLDLHPLADEDFCHLTTIGRVTGQPRTIEIWFALHGQTLYMLAGDGRNAGWVKNLLHTPAVSVRIGKDQFTGSARVVERAEEDALARQLVVGKYQPHDSEDLSTWGKTALPVAVDLSC